MINLRYHIVSLTAVFLAIGIGLAFGSSFLDQATVDNLRGQLDGLRDRIDSRDVRISDLEDRLDVLQDERTALDAEGSTLLRGLADGVPVVLMAGHGTDDDEIERLVESLLTADASVAGIWWLTDRFELGDDEEIAELAEAIGVDSTRPTTLRREATSLLAAAIRDWQALVPRDDDPPDGDDDATATDPDEPDPDEPDPDGDGEPTQQQSLDTPGTGGSIAAMFERGFIDFEAIPGGPSQPHLPDGVRIIAVGGSEAMADDQMLFPLVDSLGRGPIGPSLVVATAIVADGDQAQDGDGDTTDLVAMIRSDDELRDRVSTVDRFDGFADQAALVLALADLSSGVIGHYGTDDGATSLLPDPAGP